MACDAQRAALTALQAQYLAAEKEIASEPKPEQAAEQSQLNALRAKIAAAQDALANCLAAQQPQRVPGAQPANILSINFQTPAFGGPVTTDASGATDWASPIAGGTFPKGQGFEWKQVMDTTNEYDVNPAGASGWAAYQDKSSNDVPGLHPFGNDWEFYCALDTQYLNLVSKGNTTLKRPSPPATGSPVDELNAMNVPSGNIPQAVITGVENRGYLGVESDIGLIPTTFQSEFQDGDRVAVFGRWIVDCGHDDYHTEIHPPLLLASASVYSKTPTSLTNPDGGNYTRALFTSRPYLSGQLFANSTSINDIYNDSTGDDGHYLDHILKEIAKAETVILSTQVEAHPKIKQNPFQAVHLFEIVVGAPPGPALSATPQHLTVSFHFTVRSPCAVEVTRNVKDNSSVLVYITLNSASYTPPALPTRNNYNLSASELNNAFGPSSGEEALEGGGILLNVLDPAGLLILLAKGLQTDLYSPLPVPDYIDPNVPNAVNQAPITSIPAGQGVTVDNTQPYPVTGWVQLGWAASTITTVETTGAAEPAPPATAAKSTGINEAPPATVAKTTGIKEAPPATVAKSTGINDMPKTSPK